MILKGKKAKNNHDYANRLNVIMAIIFLLAGILIYRLFSLQVAQYDLYTALASDQHQVFNKLNPKRGKIFIQDGQDNNGGYYPLATNKEYALVYVIPKKIQNIEKTAEIFYEIFDKKEVAKEVIELLDNDEYFKEFEKDEFLEIKKELEIKLRKEIIIEKYKQKLGKKNDPYEPIKKKVDEEVISQRARLVSEYARLRLTCVGIQDTHTAH